MTTAITLLVVALLAVAVCAFIAYLVQAFRDDQIARALRETGVTPNAAPAPAPPARVPGRAIPPALRVHLCASCGTHGVSKPGDWCMPCVYRTSPVHRAEEILREGEQGRRAAS